MIVTPLIICNGNIDVCMVLGAQCSMERRYYDDAIKWCDDALLVSFSPPLVIHFDYIRTDLSTTILPNLVL